MDETAAADDIDLTDFRDWGDPERIAVNVATIYRELDPSLAGAHASRAVRADGAVERPPLAMRLINASRLLGLGSSSR